MDVAKKHSSNNDLDRFAIKTCSSVAVAQRLHKNIFLRVNLHQAWKNYN